MRATLPTHWKLSLVCSYPLPLEIALPLDIAQYFTSQSPSFFKTRALKWELEKWAGLPPLRQVLRHSLKRRLEWICKSLKASSFCWFTIFLFKPWFQCKSSVETFLWRKFSTVWGQGCGSWKERKCWSQLDIHLPVARGRFYLLGVDRWCGTNSQKEYSSINWFEKIKSNPGTHLDKILPSKQDIKLVSWYVGYIM